MSYGTTLLAGQKALIIGATSGVGLEVAKYFQACGASVVINGRDETRAAAAIRSLETTGGPVGLALGDVGMQDIASDVISAAVSYLDGLDTVVMSGASTSSPPANFFENTEPGVYVRWATTHWLSKMWLTYFALPHLKASTGGSIVYVSTDAGRFPTVGEPFACGAAAALHMMTRTLALELKRYNIRVNAVATTVMRGSPGMLVDLGDAEKVFEKVLRKQALPLEPVDVAGACTYLSSDLARSVTGQIISVNGGVSTGL